MIWYQEGLSKPRMIPFVSNRLARDVISPPGLPIIARLVCTQQSHVALNYCIYDRRLNAYVNFYCRLYSLVLSLLLCVVEVVKRIKPRYVKRSLCLRTAFTLAHPSTILCILTVRLVNQNYTRPFLDVELNSSRQHLANRCRSVSNLQPCSSWMIVQVNHFRLEKN